MSKLRGQIPFSSWDGTEPFTGKVEELERTLGGDTIVVDSYQTSVQMVCETLGSRQNMIPVILPVTASAKTFAGVYWSGAQPILLDIDPETLQVDLDALQQVLDAFEGVLVVLERVGSRDVDEAVLKAVQGVPTMVCTRWPPHDTLDKLNLCGTFNVFDLQELIGEGGVIYHKYDKQRRILRQLRDGSLGHDARLSEDLASIARTRLLGTSQARKYCYKRVVGNFGEQLQKRGQTDIIIQLPNRGPAGPVLFSVPDMLYMRQHLAKYNIPSRPAVFPLHRIDVIAKKFQDKTVEYPNADSVFNRLIALPSHKGIEEHVEFIVEKMVEATK